MPISQSTTERQGKEIHESVRGSYGFDPITILTLLPVVISLIQSLVTWFKSCRKPDPDPEPAPDVVAKYLEKRHNKGRYNPPLINKVLNEIKKIAGKKKQKLTDTQARVLAVATLDQARTASRKIVGAVMNE